MRSRISDVMLYKCLTQIYKYFLTMYNNYGLNRCDIIQ